MKLRSDLIPPIVRRAVNAVLPTILLLLFLFCHPLLSRLNPSTVPEDDRQAGNPQTGYHVRPCWVGGCVFDPAAPTSATLALEGRPDGPMVDLVRGAGTPSGGRSGGPEAGSQETRTGRGRSTQREQPGTPL